MIEEERFEEALEILQSIENAEGDRETISTHRELRGQAIERLINRERNRAAKFFLMAKNTKDPSKKQEWFTSSYKIISTLMDSYPSSPLMGRLESNLKEVEKELEKLNKKP